MSGHRAIVQLLLDTNKGDSSCCEQDCEHIMKDGELRLQAWNEKYNPIHREEVAPKSTSEVLPYDHICPFS